MFAPPTAFCFTFDLQLQFKGDHCGVVGDNSFGLCNMVILCFRLLAAEALKFAWGLMLGPGRVAVASLHALVERGHNVAHIRSVLCGSRTVNCIFGIGFLELRLCPCCTVSKPRCHSVCFTLDVFFNYAVKPTYNRIPNYRVIFHARRVSVRRRNF
jgi:hypothetical protein